MSDIQSISQGNYILATQQEVSHDNTLSGNGTVDSPLGVVPGYNETVLFSNSAGVAGSNFPVSISEPFSSFETIKFEWEMWNEGDYNRALTELKPKDNKFVLDSCYWNSTNNNLFYFAYPFTLTDLSLGFAADGKYKNLGTTATTANAGKAAFKLYGITGVNRKA